MCWTLLLAVVAFASYASAERYPREVLWSDRTFGPDGPWRAVNVAMGSGGTDQLALYPGGTWETWLIEDDYCDGSTCYASEAGTYDDSSGDDGGIAIDGGLSGFMLGMELEGDEGIRHLDDMELNGVYTEEVSLVLLKSQEIKYPGKTSPFFAGCLSLGANRSVNQTFSNGNSAPTNASVPAGWMYEHELTSSNSFGMHIGSVQPSMPGSLWFGGYDKNRVVGDILSMTGGPRDGVTLWDLGIEVIAGKSPFSYDKKDNLLAAGNSSIGSGFKVAVDGCSPYLSLPKSTCDNIAAELPVNFDEDLGLYLWNTDSDKYEEIISSASALSFSFISGSNTEPVKIRVPFMHLNLTLTEPLVDTPKPYFPCHVNGNGNYVLGRAFLQDAFIGANWHPEANTWWLAQAPGRAIQSTPEVAAIEETAKTVSKGGNDWEASWRGVWDSEETTSSSPTPEPTRDDGSDEEGGGGLSTAAIGGIAGGVGGAAILGIALGVFLFLRRRRNRAARSQAANPSLPVAVSKSESPKWPVQDQPPQEMPLREANSAPSPYHRYELS